MFTTSLYVYAMHTLNRFINRKKTSILGSFREESYLKHQNSFFISAMLALALSLTSAFITGPAPFIMLFLISFLGVLYNLNILPEGWRFRSLKDLPGSKNVSMALAWAAVAGLLPQIEIGLSFTPGMIVAFLFTFAIVFIRSALSDILDIQSDRLIGRETIPVLIGRGKTQILLKGITGILFILLILTFFAGWSSSLNLILLICTFYIWICFKLCDRRAAFSPVVLEGLLETNYVIAGFSAMVWLLVIRWII
jgi:4-hydroxy-3-methylbut-2-enyl diphosphate reductase